MCRFVAIAIVLVRFCRGVVQHGDETHFGSDGSADVDIKSSDAVAGGSMIRTERRAKKHGGTMFEVKPSGELKYHTDPSVPVPAAISDVAGAGSEDATKAPIASVQNVEPVAVVPDAVAESEHAESVAAKPEPSVPEPAESGSLAEARATATAERAEDLAALPMEKLALLQGGQQSSFPVHVVPENEAKVADGQQNDQLPGQRLIGEILQGGGQASAKDVTDHTKAQVETAMIPGMGGMGNVGDLAFRAMDMMLGTTGIIAEDYPFACICNSVGVCERDIQNTPCPHRAGQMAGARRSVSNGAAAVFVATAISTVQIFC